MLFTSHSTIALIHQIWLAIILIILQPVWYLSIWIDSKSIVWDSFGSIEKITQTQAWQNTKILPWFKAKFTYDSTQFKYFSGHHSVSIPVDESNFLPNDLEALANIQEELDRLTAEQVNTIFPR